MIDKIVGIRADLETLKTAFGNALKSGPVEQIDPQKGYRLKLGEGDDGPYLSPWYPHPETGKTSVPLEKGQIVGVLNPSGDPRQGLLVRGGYSDDHASPNDNMNANVFAAAGVRIEIKDASLKVTVGGVTHTISGEGLVTTGGKIEHNELNIGASHTHKDVITGPANTGIPNA